MAILDFAGGAALQALSECPGAARLVFKFLFSVVMPRRGSRNYYLQNDRMNWQTDLSFVQLSPG